MRVLLVTDWSALEGGTERHVELAARTLREQGDEVALMTSSVGGAADGTADYVAYGTARRSLQTGLQIVNPSAVRTLRRALREFRPDAVHLNMFLPHLSPAILAPLRDVRTLLVVHDYKSTCRNSTRLRPDGSHCTAVAGAVCRGCLGGAHYLRDQPRYAFFHAGLRHVDHVRAISRTLLVELHRAGIEGSVLFPPVEPPPADYVRRPSAEPSFVYGGRLAPVKGLDVLLPAFARVLESHPLARLEIRGDGPDRGAVIDHAHRLGLDGGVSFHIGMPRDWTESIGSAWALVAPSTYREPFGLVAVEAIERGVPVIATDGGFAETVEEGVSGTIVERGSVDALAAAMRAVADSRAAPEVPVAARARLLERHDPHAYANEVRTIFGLPREAVRASLEPGAVA